MKIIKIMDGFVTNSSSCCAVLLIAVRKGMHLEKALRRVGLSKKWVKEFKLVENFQDEREYEGLLVPEDIEFDDLLDEYDLYAMEYTIYADGGDYHIERRCVAYEALSSGLEYSKQRIRYNDDLIVLFRRNVM